MRPSSHHEAEVESEENETERDAESDDEYGDDEAGEDDVTEEMLAAGAPCGAHWIADRQSGPQILRHGTEAAKRAILPRICRGELAFAIGLSEPDSGSDLASLRTKAERVEGGWKVNGRKVWTTNAHRCDFMIALLRTSPSPNPKHKHQGLSQFLVDLRSSGISIRPILDLAGVSLSNFYRVKDYVSAASAIGQDRYPETMGKFYIINAPWAFSTVWTFIKPWLDEATVAKIDILGSGYKDKLLAQIPAESLPKEFGGTCQCPGGCSLSDAGPWNPSK